MEYSAGDSTSKDEAMKKSYESSTDETEKKKTKSKKKLSVIAPDEKSSEHAVEKNIDVKVEKKVKSGLFEVLGLEKTDNEKEKTLDTVEPAETVEAASRYVETNTPDAVAEIQDAPVDSAEEAAAAASVVFLEQLEQKLESTDEVDDSLLEQVVIDTLEELDIQPRDTEDTNEAELQSETKLEDDSEEDDDQSNNKANSSHLPSTPPPRAVPVPNPPVQPPSPPVQPPISPAPPVQPPSGPPPNNPNITPQSSGGPGNPNTAPTIATPNVVAAADTEFDHRRRRAADLLVGGVVGYFIGRRRGRINTERKLIPIQKNLEKEVKQLHKMIADKELEVRRRAVNSFENRPSIIEKRSEKITAIREKAEQKPRPPIREAEITEESKHKNEEVVIEHHEPVTMHQRTESTTEYHEKHIEKKVSQKTVETISLPLLLEIAADIKLGDVSLRTMFEQGAIDQKNLRKIVKQYMEGEKLEKIWPEALTKEIPGEELRHDAAIERQTDETTAVPSTGSQKDEKIQSTIGITQDSRKDYTYDNSTDDSENSGIVNSILFDDKKDKKTNPIRLIVFMLAAVIVAVIIISIFS